MLYCFLFKASSAGFGSDVSTVHDFLIGAATAAGAAVVAGVATGAAACAHACMPLPTRPTHTQAKTRPFFATALSL
jgi:hypothetical protein